MTSQWTWLVPASAGVLLAIAAAGGEIGPWMAVLTLGSGHTHMMQGAVQLVIFAAFPFLSIVP